MNRKHGVFIAMVLLLSPLGACRNTEPPAANAIAVTPAQTAGSADGGLGATTPLKGILEADTYDSLVQIGNGLYSLPAPVEELLNGGVVITDEKYTPDYLMDPSATGHIVAMQINQTEFQAYVANAQDSRTAMKNGEVTSIYSAGGGDIVFPKGICVGTALDELAAQWGEPPIDNSKSYDDTLSFAYYEYPIQYRRLNYNALASTPNEWQSATGRKYTITIDRNTSAIQQISQQFAAGNESADAYRQHRVPFSFMAAEKPDIILVYELPSIFHDIFPDLLTATLPVDGREYVIAIQPPSSTVGRLDAPVDEAALDEAINGPSNPYFETEKAYELRIIKNEPNEGVALGFRQTDEYIQYKAVYMTNEYELYTHNATMVPLQPGDAISESAAEAFDKMMTDYISSMKLEQAE